MTIYDCIMAIVHSRTRATYAGIKDRDKKLHPTRAMSCNYLSLHLVHAYSTQVPVKSPQYTGSDLTIFYRFLRHHHRGHHRPHTFVHMKTSEELFRFLSFWQD